MPPRRGGRSTISRARAPSVLAIAGTDSWLLAAGTGGGVNGGIEKQAGAGPLLGVRGGDRCALTLISLALDEGDAMAYWSRPRRFASIVTSVSCSATGAHAAFPRKRWRRPRRRVTREFGPSRPDVRSFVEGRVSSGLSALADSSQSERQEGRAQNVEAAVPGAVKRVANVAAPSWIR
jgi:hypothetical protein